MQDRKEELSAALIMLLDGVGYRDIADALVTALGKPLAEAVSIAVQDRLPYAPLAVIDRDWFDDRIDVEDRVFIGTDEQFTELLHAFVDNLDRGDWASQIMDEFIEALVAEGLVMSKEECPTAPEHAVLDVLTAGGKDE